MDFNNNMPIWDNEGAEPSSSLKQNGFTGGYKPPASVFNWFFSKVSAAITELQNKFSVASDKLDGIDENANNYTLPAATTNSLGGIKLSTPFSIGTDGALKASPASISAAGLMTSTQVSKLNGIASGANKTTVDSSLSSTSTNPVQNKVVYTELEKRVDKETGKGLSTNDYTNTDKNKVNSIGANGTSVTGYSPTALGNGTTAKGNYAMAIGYQTTAIGESSFASGDSTNKALEKISSSDTDEQIETKYFTDAFALAKGRASKCEGRDCVALGDFSYAGGRGTIAKGVGARSEGIATEARGMYSHACGVATIANDCQFVLGKYNTEKAGVTNTDDQTADSTLYTIGCGTSEATANAFRVTADGKCRGITSFTASGADFSEYFEWEDGNPNNEDRRGKFVTLVGDKIKLANTGDFIVGVVSTIGAFVGNSSSEQWQGKYVQDIFGDWVQEEVEIPEKIDEKTGKVIPAHTAIQYIVNPDFNPNEEYISREFRKEWSPVGLLGQVIVVDDGSCEVNGYCNSSDNGIATASNNGYRVMARIDDTHIKVLVK